MPLFLPSSAGGCGPQLGRGPSALDQGSVLGSHRSRTLVAARCPSASCTRSTEHLLPQSLWKCPYTAAQEQKAPAQLSQHLTEPPRALCIRQATSEPGQVAGCRVSSCQRLELQELEDRASPGGDPRLKDCIAPAAGEPGGQHWRERAQSRASWQEAVSLLEFPTARGTGSPGGYGAPWQRLCFHGLIKLQVLGWVLVEDRGGKAGEQSGSRSVKSPGARQQSSLIRLSCLGRKEVGFLV